MQKNKFKAVIFDVDGTLYKTDKRLLEFINNWGIDKVANCLNLDREQAQSLLSAKKKETGSSTKAMKALGIGDMSTISREVNTASAPIKEETIQKDSRLVEMVERLKQAGMKLFTLRNGIGEETVKTLRLLGFTDEARGGAVEVEKNCTRNKEELGPSFGPFEALIRTVETGRMKPDRAILDNFLNRTGLRPVECLITGDRVDVDLIPAKRLGMKTALAVWGERIELHPDVDFYLESIYDVEGLLI